MKSIIINSIIFGIVAISFSSCVSTRRGFQSSPVMSKNVELDPIKADIIVDDSKKLKGESQSSYFLIFKVDGDNKYADGITYSTDANAGFIAQFNPARLRLNKVRGAAAYKALEGGDFDVLVHPIYTTTVTNFLFIFQKYEVTVQGYGGKYSNFRTEKQKVVITNNAKEYIFPDK